MFASPTTALALLSSPRPIHYCMGAEGSINRAHSPLSHPTLTGPFANMNEVIPHLALALAEQTFISFHFL